MDIIKMKLTREEIKEVERKVYLNESKTKRNKKLVLFISMFFIVGFLGFAFAGDIIGNDNWKDKDVKLIKNNGDIISFDYTDDKTNEDVIIRNEKQSSFSLSGSDFKTSISTDKNVSGYVLIYTPIDVNLKDFKEYQNLSKVKEVCVDNPLDSYLCGDKSIGQLRTCYNQICSNKTIYYDNWNELNLLENKDLVSNIKTKNSKGVAKYKIPVNLIEGDNFFQSFIDFNQGRNFEYYIEFVENKVDGYYGHLDPFFNSSWTRYQPVTIDSNLVSGASNLTDFPILLTEDNLDHEIFLLAKSDGCDIRIANDSSGQNELPIDVVNFDTTTNTTEIWYKADNVGATIDSTFYIFYGYADAECYVNGDTYGPENVFNNNFTAVYHMNDHTTASINDTTAQDYDGSKTGANQPKEEDGIIWKAQDFSTSNWQINLGDITQLDATQYFTLEGWVNRTGATDFDCIYQKVSGANDLALCLAGSLGGVDDLFIAVRSGGYAYSTTNVLPTQTWTHVAFTYDGTQGASNDRITLYVNGVDIGLTYSGTIPTQTPDTGNMLLGFYAGGSYWQGEMDEMRISSTPRSIDWLNTTYNNVNSLSTFAINGTGQATDDTTPPTYTGFTTNSTFAGEVISASITANDNVALETNGQYIFSTNNTGVWTNGSTTNFTSTPETINSVLILNNTIGNYVCFKYYLTDNAGNKNYTAIEYCITTIASLDKIIHRWWDSTGTYQLMHLNLSVSNEPKLWVGGDIYSEDLLPEITETHSIGSSVLRWLKGWFVNLDVSGNITSLENLIFQDGEPITWNSDYYTLNIPTGLGNTIQVGQELTLIRKNNEGSAIYAGQLVYTNDSQGEMNLVSLADANTSLSKTRQIGMVTIPSCNDNSACPITYFGDINDLNTSAYVEGTKLYLSCDGSGNITDTLPSGDCYHVYVGMVTRSHASAGIISLDIERTDIEDEPVFNNLKIINNLNASGTSTLSNTNITGQTNIVGDFNQTGGNATINLIYGGMYFNNATAETLPFAVQNVWYNFTNMTCGILNGVSCDPITGVLSPQLGSVYEIKYNAVGMGQNNHLYQTGVLVNGEPQENTFTYTLADAQVTKEMTGIGRVRLNAGDELKLAIKDTTGNGNGKRYSINIIIKRVSE